jgi:hypothetical protein
MRRDRKQPGANGRFAPKAGKLPIHHEEYVLDHVVDGAADDAEAAHASPHECEVLVVYGGERPRNDLVDRRGGRPFSNARDLSKHCR